MENIRFEVIGDEASVYGYDSHEELVEAMTMLVSGKVCRVIYRGSAERFLDEYDFWYDLSYGLWYFEGDITLDKLYMPDELSDVSVHIEGAFKEGYVDFYMV